MVWVSVLQYITIYTLLAYCARRRAFLLFLSVRIPPDDKKKKRKTSSFLLSIQFTQNNLSLEILSPFLFPLGPDSSTTQTTSSHWSTILIRKATSLFPFNLGPPLLSIYLFKLTVKGTHPLHWILNHSTSTGLYFSLFLPPFPSSLLWDLSSRLFSSFFPPLPLTAERFVFSNSQIYYDDLVSYHTLGFCKRIIPDFTLFISSELIQLDWKLLLVLQIEPKLPTAIPLTVDHHGRRSCLTTKQHNPRVC